MDNYLSLTKLPHFVEENGELVVLEPGLSVPFTIARVFVVRAPKDSIRGRHAHKACSQFLICTNGSILVDCFDGNRVREFQLSSAGEALFIPPGIWASQKYLTDNAVLTVLCDLPYESGDYIRDYEDFLRYKELSKS